MTDLLITESKRSGKRLNATIKVSSKLIKNNNRKYRKINSRISYIDVKYSKTRLDSSLDNIRQSDECVYLAYPRFGLYFDYSAVGFCGGNND